MMNQIAAALGGLPVGRPTKLRPIMRRNTSAPMAQETSSLVRTPAPRERSGTCPASASAVRGRPVHSTSRYVSPHAVNPPRRMDSATRTAYPGLWVVLASKDQTTAAPTQKHIDPAAMYHGKARVDRCSASLGARSSTNHRVDLLLARSNNHPPRGRVMPR